MRTTYTQNSSQAALATILKEASGFDLHELDPQATFLELGFDSLFLIQLSQKIKNQLGVKVTFRQLIEELPNLEALLDHIAAESDLDADSTAPADPSASAGTATGEVSKDGSDLPHAAAAQNPLADADSSSLNQPQGANLPTAFPQSPASPDTALAQNRTELPPENASGSVSGLEQIITQQNQLMALQLQLLSGDPASLASAGSECRVNALADAVGSSVTSIEPKPEQATTSEKTDEGVPTAQAVAAPASHTSTRPTQFDRFGPYKPVRRSAGGGLTDTQQKSLDQLVERFAKKTAKSRAHSQRHRSHFADPRGVAGYRRIWKSIVYQISVERSAGSKLWDIDGNEYIDIAMGFGLNLFGQSPDFITQALHKQLDLGVEVGPQFPLAGEVAQLLCDFARKDRATFCNTGSEAVMAAMRLARTVTGKSKIVYFNKDYHGNFDEVLLRCNRIGGQLKTLPAAPGVPPELAQHMLVLDYGSEESLEQIASSSGEIAGVLVEPVQSADPYLQPREFLHKLRRLTSENDIALIMDEVITGFRAGQGGAQEHFDVWADMSTYGKVLGGGLPIGALAGSRRFMDALDGGDWRYDDQSEPEADMTFFAGTFVRHPLAMVAAHQVLMKLKEEGPELQRNLTAKTSHLCNELNAFFENELYPVRVAQFSSLFRFMFPTDLEYADLLYFHLLDRGIFTRGWADNCFLSTAHSDDDVARIIDAVKDSCNEIRAGGFLPKPADAVATPSLSVPGSCKERSAAAPEPQPQDMTPFALTETQQEILLTSEISQDASCANNEPFCLRLRGKVHNEHLRTAINQVLRRHAALHVKIDASSLQQFPQQPKDFDIVETTITDLAPEQQKAELERIAHRFGSTPFDLDGAPLVRLELVKIEDEEHVLMVDGHHIVTDGWSWNVMLAEIGVLYSGLVNDSEVEMPAPGSFRDYVIANPQRRSEQKEALEFWAERYATIPETLELPYDHQRATQQTHRASTVIHHFSAATYAATKQIATSNNVSLFTVGLAAFKLLLNKLSRQKEIVVGIRTAGQSMLENQNVVGLCMNVLPMRTTVDSTKSVADFLRQVQSDLLETFEHQDCTLGRIVRHLKLSRSSNRMPLTDVHFNLDRDPDNVHFEGLDIQIDMTKKTAINHDLFFNLNETANGLRLYFDYNCDLFDESTIERWIEHYEAIIGELASGRHAELGDVSGLSDQQRQLILRDWNSTSCEYPREKSITKLFEEQVARTPDDIAIIHGEETFSYAEIDRMAEQLADHLIKRGVASGDYVGILLRRSHQMVVATMAVMKIGAAYVPMDPEFPQQRLEFMARDCELQFIVTDINSQAAEIAPQAEIIPPDAAAECESHISATRREAVLPEQIAYVIYTSGSTGRPKGVQIPHGALTNFLCSMQKRPGIEARDVLAGVTTLSFDIAALELYLPLICGAKLVIVDQVDSTDGRRLADLLERKAVTILQATPATWRLMLESGWSGKSDLKILCGGEAMPTSLAGQLATHGDSLWNLYGPTETTIWSTIKQIAAPDDRVSIGRPIDNTTIYILDDHDRPVPIGVPGNLFIGGDGLASGYLNRSELTAERFVGKSIGGTTERLYYTGDLAKFLPNGEIDFIGRSDFQVKISGYRIELGEIEAVLDGHPVVAQSVVAVIEDAAQQKRLIAHVKTVDCGEHYSLLREFLRESLPEYMRPAFIQFTQQFPMTPNGKVDRKNLPQPVLDRTQLDSRFVAPRSDLEKQLADIFQTVTKMEKVGVHDDFFELGGHSLSATQVVGRIRQNFPVELTIADILARPSVAQLAEWLETQADATGAKSTIPRAKRVARQVRG